MQSIAVFIPKTQSWMYWDGIDSWVSDMRKAHKIPHKYSLKALENVRASAPNPNLVVRILNEGA